MECGAQRRFGFGRGCFRIEQPDSDVGEEG
jgi:hypothetical protein